MMWTYGGAQGKCISSCCWPLRRLCDLKLFSWLTFDLNKQFECWNSCGCCPKMRKRKIWRIKMSKRKKEIQWHINVNKLSEFAFFKLGKFNQRDHCGNQITRFYVRWRQTASFTHINCRINVACHLPFEIKDWINKRFFLLGRRRRRQTNWMNNIGQEMSVCREIGISIIFVEKSKQRWQSLRKKIHQPASPCTQKSGIGHGAEQWNKFILFTDRWSSYIYGLGPFHLCLTSISASTIMRFLP